MRGLSILRAFALLGVAMLVTPSSFAEVSTSRLSQCMACHGAQGNSQIKDIPSLAAQPKLFTETQLVLIREGVRDIPAMRGVLDGVSDEEITALAKYYEAQPLAPTPTDIDPVRFARGGELAQGMRCAVCHLPTFLGREQMPRLAGQREDYLIYSLLQFKNNEAVGRDSNMAAAVYGISDEELRDMSYYFSRLTPAP